MDARRIVGAPAALVADARRRQQPRLDLWRRAGAAAARRQPARRRRALEEYAQHQVGLTAAPATAQTHSPSNAPSARVGSASAVLGNSIYYFSGRGGTAMAPIEEHGSLWRFTPGASEWTVVSPADAAAAYPAARSYHTMASDGRSTLFVHAGCPEKGRLSDLWAFDVDARTWKSLAAAPDPPRGGASIAYAAGKLYRINGFDGTKEQGGSLDVFDLESGTWSTVTYPADGKAGPEPRSVSALLPLSAAGKTLLVTLFGEHDPSALGHAGAGKMLGNVWAYDVEGGTWAELAGPAGEGPQPRGWFAADVATSPGGAAIVVHGGLAEDNSRLGDVWVLQIA